jgi:hypothetical protein
MAELRTLDAKYLSRLMKQIHCDNMNNPFIPYKAQKHIYTIRYWTNNQYILDHTYYAA